VGILNASGRQVCTQERPVDAVGSWGSTSYWTVFSSEAVDTEKSPVITLIFPPESLFTGKTAEKCTSDFPIL
jgi:hypothetical protein